jgi:hypothetical protein
LVLLRFRIQIPSSVIAAALYSRLSNKTLNFFLFCFFDRPFFQNVLPPKRIKQNLFYKIKKKKKWELFLCVVNGRSYRCTAGHKVWVGVGITGLVTRSKWAEQEEEEKAMRKNEKRWSSYTLFFVNYVEYNKLTCYTYHFLILLFFCVCTEKKRFNWQIA